MFINVFLSPLMIECVRVGDHLAFLEGSNMPQNFSIQEEKLDSDLRRDSLRLPSKFPRKQAGEPCVKRTEGQTTGGRPVPSINTVPKDL